VKEHGFTFEDINNMTPFEFDLQSVLVMEYLENLKKLNKTKRLG